MKKWLIGVALVIALVVFGYCWISYRNYVAWTKTLDITPPAGAPNSEAPPDVLPPSAAAPEKAKLPPFSKRMAAAIIWLLYDDGYSFVIGGPSMIGTDMGLQSVTSAEVADTYGRNEVAGDKEYEGKHLLIAGTVTNIHSGIGDEPMVALNGRDQFSVPQATFKGDQSARIANLNRGDELHLICKGAGDMVGSPMFSECEFADDVARVEIKRWWNSVQQVWAGSRKPSKLEEMLIMDALAIDKLGADQSECSFLDQLPADGADLDIWHQLGADHSSCMEEAGDRFKSTAFYSDIRAELHTHGIELPPPNQPDPKP